VFVEKTRQETILTACVKNKMDKNGVMDGKKTHGGCDVHRMPGGIRGIHEKYGLWILGFGSHEASADGYHSTPPRYFEYFSISHLRSGKGRLWLSSGVERDIHPGDCVLIAPQQVHRYGGVDGEVYVEDTVCFTGPVADMLWRSGVIRSGVFRFGDARRLIPIHNMALDPSDNSQINANIALQKLLIDLHNENSLTAAGRDAHATAIDKLFSTLREQTDRWWTVEEMAEFCGLSKDHFRRVFKARAGMLPKAYLDRLKLTKASELLVSTELSVEEIASRLAYVDPYHFSRRFKKVIGFSPTNYRREFRPGFSRR
jgi:AraC-like DNA-binding protein/mannose-6-phosphate isomerase-like protein (cupin superfamily)